MEMAEAEHVAAAAAAEAEAAALPPAAALEDADADAGGGAEGGGDGDATVIDLDRLRSVEGATACPGCQKPMRKSQLLIHMRNKKCEEFLSRLEDAQPSQAPIVGRVKCPSCPHVSPNLKALRKHYASQHGVKQKCSKCDKEYGRSDALRKHEKLCGAWRAWVGDTLARGLAALRAAPAPLRRACARR